jgi:subtilisin family serine protease
MFKCILSVILASFIFSFQAVAVVNQGYDLDDQYIVVFQANSSEQQVEAAARYVVQGQGRVDHRYRHAIRGLAIKAPQQVKDKLLQRFPNIAYIEQDQLVTALPRGGKPNRDEGEEPTVEQVVPWGVARLGGPGDPEANYQTAWIIDSGIDSRHADLNVDKNRGINFARGKNTTEDGNGHGTHVAGTIAALNNDLDVVGIAPGAPVVPVRVLDNSGSGSMSGVIAGVDFVAANAQQGDCANMSLGGGGYSRALDEALLSAADKGIVFAIAAGNSAADIINYTPASTQYSNIYTISAFAQGDTVASFSNYSNNVDYQRSDGQVVASEIEFAMPGVDVLSTRAGGGTVAYNGTSMAAPHFCGLVLVHGVSGYATDGVIVDSRDSYPDPIAVK